MQVRENCPNSSSEHTWIAELLKLSPGNGRSQTLQCVALDDDMSLFWV